MTEAERKESEREVAQTIIAQLGGNHFAGMTGAKNFTIIPFSDNYPMGGVSFNLPTGGFNTKGINKVYITLDPSDTYNVSFHKVRKAYAKNGKYYDAKVTIIHESTGVYCDELKDLFERETNLLVSLFPR